MHGNPNTRPSGQYSYTLGDSTYHIKIHVTGSGVRVLITLQGEALFRAEKRRNISRREAEK